MRIAFGVVLVSAALVCASPAAALSKVATYTGIISSGSDTAGLFGTAGADLTGLSFTTVYHYDTSFGRRITVLPANDSIDGPFGSFSNPITQATLTINGVSRDAGLDFYGIAVVQPVSSIVEHEVIGDYDQYNLMYNYVFVMGAASLNVNIPTTTVAGGGLFRIGFGDGGSENYLAFGSFNTQTITITGEVPEPTTWMLMIGGFSAVGVAARRRRAAFS